MTTPILPTLAPLSIRGIASSDYFPNVRDLGYRNGISNEELVETILAWITKSLIPFENTQVELIDTGRQVGMDTLTAEVNGALSTQAATVNAALEAAVQQVITADIPIAAPIVHTILNMRNQQANAITGWFHADDFGAVHDGTTIDRAAVQAAINAANAAYVVTGSMQKVYLSPGVHAMDSVTYTRDDGTVSGATSLLLLDGVHLTGPGTLFAVNGSYGPGASYAVIRSKSGGVSNAKISEISINGNKANHSVSSPPQASNIVLVCLTNVEVSGTSQDNANGNGIMCVSPSTAVYATDIRIKNNRVTNAAGIGIQSSQFDGLDIDNNDIRYCADNAIDVYGEDGDGSTHGQNFRITNNRVSNCATGVFCETVQHGLVEGNVISACTSMGVHVNRINGMPNNILITGNSIFGCPLGAEFSGGMSAIIFRCNIIEGASIAGVQFGSGAGVCNGVAILDNAINTAIIDSTPLVLANCGSGLVSSVRVRGNTSANTNRSWDWTVATNTTVTALSLSPFNAA